MDNKKEKLNTLPQHVQVPHGLCKGQIDYQVLGLYAYLRRYMNKDTYSTFVSLRTLQGETKLSIPTIQKYLNILEEEDHIKIIKGEKRCNIYVFNKGSSLYSKGFEMYTFEFIKNKDIPFKEKCALIAFQERMMNKDSGRGTISSTPLEMSNILNTSFSTYKRIEKDLINNNWITVMKSNVKDSEIFSFDFLNNEKLDFKSKSAYIVLQEYMSKNKHLGELCDTDINICKYLGISRDTWKKLCETFLNNWNMTKTSAKDPESKDNKYLYTFDLETIGQAVLFNRKKIEEHDEMLHEMREEINNLTHELKILQKQVNVQNQEEIKSNCKLKVI